jgi:hypothetical protein
MSSSSFVHSGVQLPEQSKPWAVRHSLFVGSFVDPFYRGIFSNSQSVSTHESFVAPADTLRISCAFHDEQGPVRHNVLRS